MARQLFVKVRVYELLVQYLKSQDKEAWTTTFFQTLHDGKGDNEYAMRLLETAQEEEE
jgi:hypothetical protein